MSAAEPPVKGDEWFTDASARPEKFAGAAVSTNLFGTLRAEVVAGVLQVKCEGHASLINPQLVSSADLPGHWPARDWRTFPMRRAGPNWIVDLPVDSLDVPQIYFVTAHEAHRVIVSPMRLASPRALGLEKPTRLFWAFVEGFEQDLDGWRSAEGIHTESLSRSGKASLRLRVPAGRPAVSAATTRVRGWYIQEHGADGIGVWLRTTTGTGEASFTLAGNAYSTNQFLSRRAQRVAVSTNWSKARLTFDSFPKPPLTDLDLFIIEFVAEPGTELLVDDLHLLGRWRENF